MSQHYSSTEMKDISSSRHTRDTTQSHITETSGDVIGQHRDYPSSGITGHHHEGGIGTHHAGVLGGGEQRDYPRSGIIGESHHGGVLGSEQRDYPRSGIIGETHHHHGEHRDIVGQGYPSSGVDASAGAYPARAGTVGSTDLSHIVGTGKGETDSTASLIGSSEESREASLTGSQPITGGYHGTGGGFAHSDKTVVGPGVSVAPDTVGYSVITTDRTDVRDVPVDTIPPGAIPPEVGSIPIGRAVQGGDETKLGGTPEGIGGVPIGRAGLPSESTLINAPGGEGNIQSHVKGVLPTASGGTIVYEKIVTSEPREQ